MSDFARLRPSTIAAQAMGAVDPQTRALVPPLHVSTTYLRDADNQYRSGYVYGRPDNASVRQVEAILAALEQAAGTLVFSSGMAAATAVVLALEPPARIVAPKVMYWAFRHWLVHEAPRFGYSVDIVDMTDLKAVEQALAASPTALIWVETPGNPLWTLTDIAAVAALARAAGTALVVDSTVATPLHTRPLDLGADLVMHSATKYLNGHSDVVAGVLATARDDARWSRLKAVRASHGAILGPFEAWLLMRGLRTLDVRVKAQTATAGILAARLARHERLSQVLYPGLPQHPGHDIALRQMAGFGAMMSIRVKGGAPAAIAAAARVAVWKRATSLGGVESLIEHRASIEGPQSPCPDDLLRLSVGLEDIDDLYADLDAALRA